ncbi:MAG: phosphotransferase [Anaerolineales bacterium]|nr:phosphotransferase [Anaerolineales bacterium]
MNHSQPNETQARAVAEAALGVRAQSVSRFATGLAHFVFEVTLAGGVPVVVRLSTDPDGLNGAVAWSRRLRPLGVPLPDLLFADLEATITPFPAIVLARLPGTDLGHVIDTLSVEQKQAIAAVVVAAQRCVHRLPLGGGYGYVAAEAGPFPHRAWVDVIAASLSRSRARITAAGIFDPALVTPLEHLLPKWERYGAMIQPVAFLDDTTTKNVIIDAGRLSGIVDVDVVCYGDPLWTIALTRMALLSGRQAVDYVEHWCTLLDLTREQRGALDFYTAVFCVDFMSEVGQMFNQATPLAPDRARTGQLNALYGELLRQARD